MTSWLWRAVFASFVCLAQMAAQDPVAEAKQKIAAAELRVQRAELERDQAKLAVRTAEGGDARKAAEERLGRLEKELERRSVELESAKLAARAAELDSKEAAAKKPAGPMTLGEALPKAKEGDVDAQYQMGLVFLVPRGVDRDLAQAAAWFAKAAEQGHAEAMARLGKLYAETPLLWPGRKDEGIRLLKLAMEKGSVAAAVDLGYITEDPVEKARLYARAEPRSPRGRLRLGLLTLEGKGVAKDQAEGLRLIELARAGGDPRVQVELGRCYEDGECGLSKNPGAAAKLYAEAAARGSAEGEYRLSWCYSEGRGVAKNQEESLRLLESAAAKWDPQAQWLLGSKLVNGYDDAVAQNVEEGARLLALGAAQGDIAAMSELSGVLLWGEGSMGEFERGMTYLRRAAATGWFDAVGRLAAELMAGKHTPRDVAQARRLAAGEEMAHMGFYIAYVRPLSRAGYDYGELSKLDQLYSRALKGDEKATRDFIAKMDRPWSKWKRQSTSSWGERVTSVLDSLNTALATAPPIPRVPAR